MSIILNDLKLKIAIKVINTETLPVSCRNCWFLYVDRYSSIPICNLLDKELSAKSIDLRLPTDNISPICAINDFTKYILEHI